MNIKKSFIALALLMLVLPVLMLPVSAATSYTFDYNNGSNIYGFVVPEGSYNILISTSDSEWRVQADAPIEIVYAPYDDGDLSVESFWSGTASFTDFGETASAEFVLACEDGLSLFVCELLSDGVTITFTPLINDPVLSNVVTPEMLNESIDEIIQLLPITLIAIACFIGIRKGISYLQSILYQA